MDKYFDFLEELRESGITNMFGAVPFIKEEFGISEEEGKEILEKWFKSFNE